VRQTVVPREQSQPLALGNRQGRGPSGGPQLAAEPMSGSYELTWAEKPTNYPMLRREHDPECKEAIAGWPKRLEFDVIVKILTRYEPPEEYPSIGPMFPLTRSVAFPKVHPLPNDRSEPQAAPMCLTRPQGRVEKAQLFCGFQGSYMGIG